MVLQTHDFCIENNAHRGVEQLAARGVHSPKVGGSSPSPATNLVCDNKRQRGSPVKRATPKPNFETRMSKEAVITSSRLNCYGTRVLTEGIELEQYYKNPILLYMHRRGSRDDMPIGIIENIRVDGDFIYGTPKFDGDTEEEKIIAAKWKRGTLRMLSAGLEIIECSEDEKYLVQGQTRPTVIRSKLIEVSVVDIGGNDDALQTVRLYQDGKLLTLAQGEECEHLPLLKSNTPTSADEEGAGNSNIQNTFQMNKILELLGLAATATEDDAVAAIKGLQEQNAALNLARITDAVDAAVAEKRITADKKEHFITLGKQSGIENLRTTLSLFTPAQKPTDVIKPANQQTNLKWENCTSEQLEALREENREEYIRLFKERFGFAPDIQ